MVVASAGVEVKLGSWVFDLEVSGVVTLRDAIGLVACCSPVELGADCGGAETYTLVGTREDGRDDTAGKLVATGAVPSDGDGSQMPGAIPDVKPKKPSGD